MLIAGFLNAGPAGAQSFDCQNARTPDEKTICQDPRLGQLDQELASVYRRGVGKLPKAVRKEIEENETLFVKARRRCAQDRNCIEQSYRNRIEEIQGAIAERASDTSARARASELRRRSSGGAAAIPERDLTSSEHATGAAAKHQPPKRTGTTTASATPPKEQTPAPSQPASAPELGSGSTGWVNPPPER